MTVSRRSRIVVTAFAVIALVALAAWWWTSRDQPSGETPAHSVASVPAAAPAPAAYVGSQACAACHVEETKRWRTSQHAIAMQVADERTVLGDFSGKRLRLSGWMRSESLQTNASLKIFCHTTTDMVQETSTRLISGSVDWSPVVVEIDVPPDTWQIWVWMMYMAPIPGRVWVDDMEVAVLGPATGQPTPVQPPLIEGAAAPGKRAKATPPKPSGSTRRGSRGAP